MLSNTHNIDLLNLVTITYFNFVDSFPRNKNNFETKFFIKDFARDSIPVRLAIDFFYISDIIFLDEKNVKERRRRKLKVIN
jgi:hypothetical protein